MPLNIKNERVSNLAHELAAITGKSITEAVGRAVESKLEELKRENERQQMYERIMEISRSCAPHFTKEWRERNFDEELYDEKGLPR
jgi:antitoxin VapB